MRVGLCWLASSGALLPVPAASQRLHLTGAGSLPVPESFRVAGGSVTPGVGLVLWSIDSPFVYHLSRQGVRRIPTPGVYRPLAARLTADGDVVLIWDQPALLVGRVSDGRLTSAALRGLGPDQSVETAVGLGSGWVLGGRESGGGYWFALLSPAGVVGSRIELPGVDPDQPQTFLLSASPAEVFAVNVRPPFQLLRVGKLRGDTPTLTCDTLGQGLPDSLVTPTTVSLPAIPIDSGFVQTLADQRDDHRYLAVLDTRGHLVRATRIAVPLGFFASDGATHRLFAALRAGGAPVLAYTWSWTSTLSQE